MEIAKEGKIERKHQFGISLKKRVIFIQQVNIIGNEVTKNKSANQIFKKGYLT